MHRNNNWKPNPTPLDIFPSCCVQVTSPFLLFKNFLTVIYLMCVYIHDKMCIQRSKNSLHKYVLLLHHMSPTLQIQGFSTSDSHGTLFFSFWCVCHVLRPEVKYTCHFVQIYLLVCMCFPWWVYVHHVHARAHGGPWVLGAAVTGSCERTLVCWEPNCSPTQGSN